MELKDNSSSSNQLKKRIDHLRTNVSTVVAFYPCMGIIPP